MTIYEKRKKLSTNSLFAAIVAGLLVYQMYQAYSAPDPMPVWFIIIMVLMIAACGGLMLRNYKIIKSLDKQAAELAAEQELAELEAAEQEDEEDEEDWEEPKPELDEEDVTTDETEEPFAGDEESHEKPEETTEE